MDEITLKQIFKSEMQTRRHDLNWVLEIIMTDCEIGYIIDQLKGRIRAIKKQEEY